MLHERLKYLERHGGDVRPHTGRLDHVHRVPKAGRQHLRFIALDGVDLTNVGQYLQAVRRDVVQPTQEWRNNVRTRFGGENRLGGSERQGDVHLDALVRELAYGRQAIWCHGDLDDRVVGDLSDLASLSDEYIGVVDRRLDGNVTVNDRADLLDQGKEVLLLRCDVSRIGGNTAQDSPTGGFSDLVEPGRIKRQFHVWHSLRPGDGQLPRPLVPIPFRRRPLLPSRPSPRPS